MWRGPIDLFEYIEMHQTVRAQSKNNSVENARHNICIHAWVHYYYHRRCILDGERRVPVCAQRHDVAIKYYYSRTDGTERTFPYTTARSVRCNLGSGIYLYV